MILGKNLLVCGLRVRLGKSLNSARAVTGWKLDIPVRAQRHA